MRNKLFYGFGSLSYSVISQTISNFFMFFATTVLGVSGTLVGVAVAISTIWDGISDTLFGYLSDTKKIGNMGYRRGYMLIASIGLSVSNLFLWCVPNDINIGIKFVWILVSLLIVETFNTMFSTPYMALGNEIAKSHNDRTKVNAYSTIFFLIGIMIPSILLYVFLPNTPEYPIGQLNPKGYVNIAIVTSIICLFFGFLSSVFTKNKVDSKIIKSEKFSLSRLISNFLKAFKNKDLRIIILGYMFTSIATVFLCSVGLHFFTYSLFYNSKQITFLLLSLMLGTIISQPLWVVLSRKKSKKSALISGIILTILSVFMIIIIYLFRLELLNSSYYIMLSFIFICGVGSGSLYSLPSAIYGDVVMGLQNSDNSMVASYTSSLTFAGNIANSITQIIVGIMLDLIRFDSTMQVQSLAVQTGLSLILFIGVQFSLILSCLIFVKFKEKSKIFDK